MNRLLRAALAYADLGWAVFPLAPRDKVPLLKDGAGVHDATTDHALIKAWWHAHSHANIGLAMGPVSGVMALDIDVKSSDGFAALAALTAEHGPLPETPCQETGIYPAGRGRQFVFRDFEGARNSAGYLDKHGKVRGIAPGVDTRGKGGYIMAAPSVHPGGATYGWIIKPSQMQPAEAPDWLQAWFQRPAKAATPVPTSPPDWSSVPPGYVRAALDREYAAAAGAGKGGRNAALNRAAFSLGQLVGSGALPRSVAEHTVRAAAAANGWAADEGDVAVDKVIRSGLEAGIGAPRLPPAGRAAPARGVALRIVTDDEPEASASPGASMGGGPGAAPGASCAAASAAPPRPRDDDWRDALILNADGGVKRQSIANAVAFLLNEDRLDGLFVHDDFLAQIVVTRAPPWALNGFEPGPITDPDIAGLRVYLERQGITVSKMDAYGAIEYVAAQRHVNCVRDYFTALNWDGVQRLDNWLTYYLGVEPSRYVAAVGSKWMISAVCRAMRPGCKVDTMLILEGPQGLKKSTALATLATLGGRRYFTDELAAIGSKDAAMQLQGNLVIEIAELDALDRAEVKAVKAFLTRQTDKVRLPYARTVSSLPRACVFAGTVNPEGGGYLRDPTGGRRFWPVECTSIDLPALEADRDQLWAEAVVRWRAGESHWLDDEEVLVAARDAQEARREEDPLIAALLQYLRDKTRVTTDQVLRDAWSFPAYQCTNAASKRAGNALRAIGWGRKRVRLNGQPSWLFYDPTAAFEHTDQTD